MRTSVKRTTARLLAGIAGAGLLAGPTLAQETSNPARDATAAADADTELSLSDIVVTAQKRDETLLSVPVSVTALKTESLISQNLVRLEDYATRIPGLAVAGNQTNRITIRGIGSDPAASPTVAVTIDDVPFGSSSYIGKGQFPDLDPSDLQQIEVLRGPQGTLYGASSLGGLIKFVTKNADPNNFSARVEGTYQTVSDGGSGYAIRGSVNIPIIDDVLGVRASAYRRHDPGLVDMYSRTTGQLVQKDANTGHFDGYRVAAYFHPFDALTINAAHLYQKRETTNGGATLVQPNSIVPVYGFYANDNASQFMNTNLRQTQLRAELDLGTVVLNSVSGWGKIKNDNNTDNSRGFGFILPFYPSAPADTQVRISDKQLTSKFSQEVRLSSTGHGSLDWLLGGFYTNEHSNLPQQIYLASPSGNRLATIYDFAGPTSFREYAAFADVTYRFDEHLDLQVGGRYSHNKQVFAPQTTTIDAPARPIFGPSTTVPLTRSSDNQFTWLVSPRYKFNPDTMVYVRVATGYRPGGPNPAAAPTRIFDADTVTSYELGFKGKLLDGMLALDTSVFNVDQRKTQLNVTDVTQAFTYFINGGKSRSRGVEAQAVLSPGLGFQVTGNMAVTDAKLRDNLPVTPGTYTLGSKGDRLPFTAKFTSNLGVQKDFNLFDDARLFVGANWNHVGSRLSGFKSSAYPAARRARLELPSYDVVDLRAGVSYRNFAANVFARNVTNEHGIVGRTDSATSVRANTISLIQPRTIGVDVSVNF